MARMAAKKKLPLPRPVLGASQRIIGIDSSLTKTGVSKLLLGGEAPVWQVTSIGSTPHEDQRSLVQLSQRIAAICDRIEAFVGGWQDGDVVIFEGYMMMAGPSRGNLMALWYEIARRLAVAGIEPIVIAPATRQTYAVGGTSSSKSKEADGDRRSSGKDGVIIQVSRRFPDADVANNDEADAVFLAAIGASLCGFSIEPKPLPKTHLTFERHFEPAKLSDAA